jgi:hypothetical protein
MKLTTGILPVWMKQAVAIDSLLLTLAGIPVIFGFACITLMLVVSEDSAAIIIGLISFLLLVLTIGAGGITFWHSTRSIQNKVSPPLRLPSSRSLLSVFGLHIIVGLVVVKNTSVAGVLLPPIVFGIAILPPLLTLSWFIDNRSVDLTYRHGGSFQKKQ